MRVCSRFYPAAGDYLWQLVGFEPGAAPDIMHGMIRLDVNVTDKSGDPVVGLTQQGLYVA
jgi:hypothetical protein